QLPPPVMRRGTGLHRHDAPRKRVEKLQSVRRLTERAMTTLPVASTARTRKTLLARSSPTRMTPDVSMIDLPMDCLLPDGAFNNHHLGTLDAVRGAVHLISKGSTPVGRSA